MVIQPPVQSATPVATFVNSTSATGVEQPVARTPIMPVDQSGKGATADNSTRQSRFQFAASTETAASTQKTAPDSTQGTAEKAAGDASGKTGQAAADSKNASTREQQQIEADRVVISQLKARDREVRLHEAAHAAVGGRHAGAPVLQYSRGPDGKNYATAGEVSISTSPVSGDPQATIEKARVIRAAAMAPAEPSSQDRRVAAQAGQMEVQAQADLRALDAETRAAEEKARTEKLEQEKARKAAEAEAESAVQEEESAPVEEQAQARTRPEPPVVQVASRPEPQQDKEATTTDEEEEPVEEPRPNAQQRLEKILLGSRGVLVDANQLGLVDPRSPYGASGFLDLLA